MSFLPGWDSIESSGAIAHALHVSAVVVLGLLVVAEGLALIYDSHNHSLVGIAENARIAQTKRDSDVAEARRKTEVDELQKQLGEAAQKLTNLQKGATHRSLLPEQKLRLIEALKPFAGQKVTVAAVMGSDDGLAFANDFMEVFRAAQWDIDPGSPTQAMYGNKTPVGLEPTMNQGEAEANRVPNSFVKLIETLAALNLAPPRAAFVNPEVEIGRIEMRIGVRPAPR